MTDERIATKPEPIPTLASRPFWEGCAEGELRLPRCTSCHRLHFPPRPFCPHCGAEDLSWIRSSGTGTVWSTTTVHTSFWGDAWADDLPYTVAIVELDEGVRLVSAVIGHPADIGARVEVTFVDRGTATLPMFRVVDP